MGQLQNGSGGPEGEHLLEVADGSEAQSSLGKRKHFPHAWGEISHYSLSAYNLKA